MSYPNYPDCGQVYTTTHKYTDSYACDPNISKPMAEGVTTWELSSPIVISGSTGGTFNSHSFSFTCTYPQCYSGRDVCNVTFEAYANQSVSDPLSEDIFLGNALNTIPLANKDDARQYQGGFYLSGTAGYGGWQTTDVSRINGYNDPFQYQNNTISSTIPAPNTFWLTNYSTVDVTISHFRILRAYKMGNLQTPSTLCTPGGDSGSSGNLDNVRVDRPCNYYGCGGRSYSFVYDGTNANDGQGHGTLSPNGAMTWTFDFTNCGSTNYLHGEKCLFNFNQMYARTTDSNSSHVKVDAYLNGQSLTTYYFSNQGPSQGLNHSMFPSYDLIQSSAYNDTGPNTIQLINRGNVDIIAAPPLEDGINIYRVFSTGNICEEGCGSGQSCIACYSCYVNCVLCYNGCDSCVSCYNGCDTCDGCYSGCYNGCDTCVSCNTSCYNGCDACVSCNAGCDTCVSCDNGCYGQCITCYGCDSCFSGCYGECYIGYW